MTTTMSDGDTRTILEAIKDQGERTEKAIEHMADRLVDILKHLKKNGHAMPIDRGADVKMIAVVVAICFGLASPVGIVLVAMNDRMGRADDAMAVDNTRELSDAGKMFQLEGGIFTNAANIAAAADRCESHTTRDDRLMEKMQAWQADHDLRVRGLNAAQWERIYSLEREIYNTPPPTPHANGNSW